MGRDRAGWHWAGLAAILAALATSGCEANGPSQRDRMASAGAPAAAEQAGIVPHITGRSTSEVLLGFFYDGPLVMDEGYTLEPYSRVLEEMRAATVGCEASVLSLGEGRSSFIYHLLRDRQRFLSLPRTPWDSQTETPEQECALERIHAVDVSYAAHDSSGEIVDARLANFAPHASMGTYDALTVDWVREFPKNYHSQLFQSLDLRDDFGTRRKFSLIFSVQALAPVLCRHLSPDERRSTLRRIVDHLEPGGMLLMAPVLSSWGGCMAGTYEELAAMKGEGLIESHSIAPDPEPDQYALVAIK